MAKLIITLNVNDELVAALSGFDNVKQLIGFLHCLKPDEELSSNKATETIVNKNIRKVTLTVTNELPGV